MKEQETRMFRVKSVDELEEEFGKSWSINGPGWTPEMTNYHNRIYLFTQHERYDVWYLADKPDWYCFSEKWLEEITELEF